MSERTGIVLGTLLAVAAAVALTLALALVNLGGGGLVALASSLVGVLSACAFFLSEPHRVPLSSLALVAVVLTSLAALARALAGAARQQRLLHLLTLERARDERLIRLADAAGLPGLWLVPARRPAAFCFGLLRPRVVVTRGLLDRLEPDEQEAAIWHEAHHARRRQPLRCLAARLAAASFAWLPALKDLCDRYMLLGELDADRLAVQWTSRRALAAALFEVGATPVPAGAIGLGESADARVDRLLDPAATLPPLWRRSRIVASALSVIALTSAMAIPVRLDLSACARVRSLLIGASSHGLPAITVGIALAALLLSSIMIAAHHWLAPRGARKARTPLR